MQYRNVIDPSATGVDSYGLPTFGGQVDSYGLPVFSAEEEAPMTLADLQEEDNLSQPDTRPPVIDIEDYNFDAEVRSGRAGTARLMPVDFGTQMGFENDFYVGVTGPAAIMGCETGVHGLKK